MILYIARWQRRKLARGKALQALVAPTRLVILEWTAYATVRPPIYIYIIMYK